RVVSEQTNHRWSPLQQSLYKISEPGLILGASQGREPHLPIEPRHMGCDKARASHDVTRLPGEGIGEPGLAIVAALDDDFRAGGGHDGKQAIGVDRAKWGDPIRHLRDGRGPLDMPAEAANGLYQAHNADRQDNGRNAPHWPAPWPGRVRSNV